MSKTKEYRNEKNQLHREDGPAVTEHYADAGTGDFI